MIAPAAGGPALSRVPFGRVAIIWLLLAAVQVARTMSLITDFHFPDPDDMLRLVQVRDLLAGQGWFDLHQYRIDGPNGVLMHWSRLVDAPLALVAAVFAPMLGAAAAEQVAIIGVPLLTLAAILVAVARTASRWLDREGVTLACLCVGLAPLLMAQVQPLRIDHHGWQIFCVVLALAGLAQGARTSGAVLAGAALALGMSISMEVLPLAAAFGMAFGLRWLSDGVTRFPLVAFLATFAGGLAVLFLATRGLGDLVQHCDVVAPAHLGLFGVVALGVGGVALLQPRTRPALFGFLALTGAVGIGFYLWAAPDCAAGPFSELDPLVREFWYENVAEGRPAWRLHPALWLPIAGHGVIALFVLVHLWRSETGAARRWWFEYLLALAVALVTGLLVWRSLAFVGALSAIPLGWLAARLLRAFGRVDEVWRKIVIAGALTLALVPAFPMTVAMAFAPSNELARQSAERVPACRFADVVVTMNSLPEGKIFAPLDVGPALLLRTHHEVVATGHHRASNAMHDVIAAFTGTQEQAHDLVMKHEADYVLMCAELNEAKLYARKAPKGFAAMLMAGQVPAWLEPVQLNVPASLKVWRVRQ